MISSEGFCNRKKERIDKLAECGQLSTISSSSTSHEQNCILFLYDYQNNFKSHYPDRLTPFLICCDQNEVQRIVCTMVAPTMLSNCALYDAITCSRFFARFMQHEPLAEISTTPYYLPSSDCIINWGIADSFDASVLLCSVLIGFGYDAYVAWGKTDLKTGQCDESNIMYTDDSLDADFSQFSSASKDEAKETISYSASSKLETSSYDVEMKSRNKQRPPFKFDLYSASMDIQAHEAFNQQHSLPSQPCDNNEANEFNAKDEPSTTIHAWVYLKTGKRGQMNDLFIEATTGRSYAVTGSVPYQTIEGMWNQRNYWINVQETTNVTTCNLDLNATWNRSPKEPEFHCWEHVFHDTWDLAQQSSGREMQCPPSTCPIIQLSHEQYNTKFLPNGRKAIFYSNAKVDLFSPGSQFEGLIKRVVVYLDPEHTIIASCDEFFDQRSDHLIRRRTDTLDMKCTDYYSPGLETGLKTWTECVGSRRSIQFYVEQRVDGIESIDEAYGKRIIIRYQGRHDGLIFRRVDFVSPNSESTKVLTEQRQAMYLLPSSDKASLQVSKIVVEYETQAESKSIFKTNTRKTEGNSVSKRVFLVDDGKITTKYHYDKDRITTTEEEEKIGSGRVGALSDLDKGNDMKNSSLLSLEREAIASVYLDTLRLSDSRISYKPSLSKSVFEKAIANASTYTDSSIQNANSFENDGDSVDYLHPFLRHCKDPNNLSREEAQQTRDSCLQSLKDRLVERTNIIQDRLMDENSKLSKRQELYQRNQREGIIDSSISEDYEKYCTESMFRIKVLEQRLVSHEENANKKFSDLESKLSKDSRLFSLHYLT